MLKSMFRFEFWRLTLQNFHQKAGWDAAVVLAYASLIGLVPFFALVLNLFSVSEAFASVKMAVMHEILPYILPDSAEKIELYLVQFSTQASHLPTLSIVAMLVTVLFLMSNVDDKINQMWHQQMHRVWWHSLLHYLGIALVGPFLLALSFIVSSSLLALPLIKQSFQLPILNISLLTYLPNLIGLLGFVALYRWVPIKRIPWSAAFLGSVWVVIVLFLLKLAFQYYVLWFPTYNLIYGAFAIVPLFLLWLYLIWLVVILGASVVRQLCISDSMAEENLPETLQTAKQKGVDL